MKHATKSMLLTGAIVFCLGLIVTLMSYIYAVSAGITIFDEEIQKPEYVTYTETIDDIARRSAIAGECTYPVTNFTKINIDCYVANISIKPTTEKSYIKFTDVDSNNILCSVKNDTLVIQNINPITVYGLSVDKGFSFNGLRQIFNVSSGISKDRKIEIFLNPNDNFSFLTCNTTVGSVFIDSISMKSLQSTVNLGKIDIKNSASTDEPMIINGDFTDINLIDSTYISCNVYVVKGDITAKVINNKASFETGFGSISIETTSYLPEYSVRMRTNFGSVKVNNNEVKGSEFNNYSATNNSISVVAMIGNISLKYPVSEITIPQTPSEANILNESVA